MPLNVALAVIPSLPRPLLSRLVQRAIERLDEIDGDPDSEPNGDESDGVIGEDDPLFHNEHPVHDIGAGCPISDPDYGAEEPGEIDTFSHWMDHPPELHLGKRPGWND